MEIVMGYNFKGAASKRLDQQLELEGKEVLQDKAKEKKERYNFSIYPSNKKKLDAMASEMGISSSSLIEIWISEKSNA